MTFLPTQYIRVVCKQDNKYKDIVALASLGQSFINKKKKLLKSCCCNMQHYRMLLLWQLQCQLAGLFLDFGSLLSCHFQKSNAFRSHSKRNSMCNSISAFHFSTL